MNLCRLFIASCLVLAYVGIAVAEITPEEAKKLGTILTPFGAEIAGNTDGSIPAYTGGLTKGPTNYKQGSGVRPSPFADEKPLFSVNFENMNQFANKLTEGTKALMKKYSSYRIDIYKTHRTAAFPNYVLDETVKQAVTTKTANNGLTLVGAHASYPFPIPKDGYEAMWNHLVRFQGIAFEHKPRSMVVNAAGRSVMTYESDEWQDFPYWDQDKKSSLLYFRGKDVCIGPPRSVGEQLMVSEALDLGKGRRVWQYLPGQRRTKLAPDISFNTPNTQINGVATYDDYTLYNGSMDRFDFKLVGKKEMYVPYSNYKLVYDSKRDDLLKPKHLNPDVVRWELHRVWVVEATLKPDKRHIYSKRIFYLDEDTWTIVASDQYDGLGQLYKAGFLYIVQNYDANTPFSTTHGHYDLNAGNYSLDVWPGETGRSPLHKASLGRRVES